MTSRKSSISENSLRRRSVPTSSNSTSQKHSRNDSQSTHTINSLNWGSSTASLPSANPFYTDALNPFTGLPSTESTPNSPKFLPPDMRKTPGSRLPRSTPGSSGKLSPPPPDLEKPEHKHSFFKRIKRIFSSTPSPPLKTKTPPIHEIPRTPSPTTRISHVLISRPVRSHTMEHDDGKPRLTLDDLPTPQEFMQHPLPRKP